MIGWAFRQLVIYGAFAALFYAFIGYRLLEQPSATDPAPAASAPATSASNRAPAGKPPPNSLIYRADKTGHVWIDGSVNGAPVRFLVDTGATYVALSLTDAKAAGLAQNDLQFNVKTNTANGVARAAQVKLREVRLGQFSVADVPAWVGEKLGMSVLGQSFLTRLESYEMRDGVLTLNWN